MSDEVFVVCGLSNETDTPLVLSAYQGPRSIDQDYFYWSTNPDSWLNFEDRNNALEEGLWLLDAFDSVCVDKNSVWVMPWSAAAQLFGEKIAA